jgi:hypothetical protein
MPSIINSDNGTVSGSAGLKITSADDGILEIQNSGNTAVTVAPTGQATFAHAVSQPGAFMFRNRIMNGNMSVDQSNAGAAQTITAAAALAYTIDRWYAYCTGANVTGQRVAGSGDTQYRYRFTGAASVTKIGFAQRIEAINSFDLNNSIATLSVDLSNSLLTTVTWTAWYANTADTFGTLASPTRTQIATGTFTVNSTLSRYSTQISIPSAATTGIEIEFSVGAQISGTWVIGNVQLEKGSVATTFEQRPYGTELALCQRYYLRWKTGGTFGFSPFFGFAVGTTSAQTPYSLPVEMRVTPFAVDTGGSFRLTDKINSFNITGISIIGTSEGGSTRNVTFVFSVSSGLTLYRPYFVTSNNDTNAYLGLSAEL